MIDTSTSRRSEYGELMCVDAQYSYEYPDGNLSTTNEGTPREVFGSVLNSKSNAVTPAWGADRYRWDVPTYGRKYSATKD